MKIVRNIEFGKSTAGKSLTMISIEEDDGVHNKPAMVCIHGGGWSAGDAESMVPWSSEVARMGFKCFSIEYTLCGEAKWPAQIEDCKTAVRHIRANAEKYDIDPGRIGAFGHSAGGHLCCMLGVLKQGEYEGTDYPGVSSAVQGVIDYSGLEKLSGDNISGGAEPLVWGPEEEKAVSACPFAHVSPESAPHLIIHGTGDDLVPYQPAELYRDRLIENGVFTKWLLVKDGWHIIDNYNIWKDIEEFCMEVFLK